MNPTPEYGKLSPTRETFLSLHSSITMQDSITKPLVACWKKTQTDILVSASPNTSVFITPRLSVVPMSLFCSGSHSHHHWTYHWTHHHCTHQWNHHHWSWMEFPGLFCTLPYSLLHLKSTKYDKIIIIVTQTTADLHRNIHFKWVAYKCNNYMLTYNQNSPKNSETIYDLC